MTDPKSFIGNKVYAFISIALTVTCSLVLFYSDQGLMRLRHLKDEKSKLESVNSDLREENRRLVNRIKRVKSDAGYIEDEARRKLGLIRPDEVIYRLREEPDLSYDD